MSTSKRTSYSKLKNCSPVIKYMCNCRVCQRRRKRPARHPAIKIRRGLSWRSTDAGNRGCDLVFVSFLCRRATATRKQATRGRGDVSVRPVAKKHVSEASDRQEVLLQELLDLDTAYEAGKIKKTEYEQRRAKTKALLRSVMNSEPVEKGHRERAIPGDQRTKKSFNLKPILRSVDLFLDRGECMALLGANGSGKTTLLRILAALIKPDTGTVCIGGWDIERDAQQVRRLVGFVTHQPYLYDELTALENLLFFGRMYAVKRPRERAAELLQRVGLAKGAGERAGALSRGQRSAWLWRELCYTRRNCSCSTSRIRARRGGERVTRNAATRAD